MLGLPDLSQLSHAQKDALIVDLFGLVQRLSGQVEALQKRITELESRPRLHSKNSSKPPASDGLAKPNSKPNPKSLRIPGQNPNGGQPGHSGNTLMQTAQPDVVIQHTGAAQCSACHSTELQHAVIERRQVFDLPVLRAQVTEHQLMRSTCTCGAEHVGAFPAGLHAPTQYGPSVKALAVHLNQQHFVPLQRTCSLLADVFALPMSQASVLAFTEQAAQHLGATVAAIGQAVQAAPIVHADESGIRLAGHLEWLHCVATPTLTYLAHHPKRGAVAFDALGILGGVRGTLVHDGLLAYKNLDCLHSLCNAHHLRELTYVHEQMEEQIWDAWAQEMMALLLQGKQEVDAHDGPLPASRLAWFEGQWSALLLRGEASNPAATRDDGRYDPKPRRGRVAQSKAYNLLKRLRDYRQDVWRFASDAGVPFTNNLAEQALRMSKIRQKVSGCFRTDAGAKTFFTIRSYLQTMRKQQACLFDCLISVFKGQPIQPSWAG
jgi:transposase